VCLTPQGSTQAPNWNKVFVGVLTAVDPHPHADREVVVAVDAGAHRLTVVTGGPRVAVGAKVAVALPGARVVDADAPAFRTTKLKRRRIRGVLSEGMLCSAKELGLSDDHASIYVLPPDAPVGVPFRTWVAAQS
jgi:phenylalanyl-tRNA synthetase beta chain